jgi:glycosyltransferase involved in cell wall biosynthesis
MKNVLFLTKNMAKYKSGYYYQDIADAWEERFTVFFYGPGYPNYSVNQDICQLIDKVRFQLGSLDLVVFGPGWDEDASTTSVAPPNRIGNLKDLKVPIIYYLNKEYKKLSKRLDYALEIGASLVCSVHPDVGNWCRPLGLKSLVVPFAHNPSRFRNLNLARNIDFMFTGGMHSAHSDARYRAKSNIFDSRYLNKKTNRVLGPLYGSHYLRNECRPLDIYWAEFGSKNIFGRTLIPYGKRYARLLNSSKACLSTPSAIGIFGTRFFEAMACGSIIICPKAGEYDGILKDNVNCLMYRNENELPEILNNLKYNYDQFRKIQIRAFSDVECHDYGARVQSIENVLNDNSNFK